MDDSRTISILLWWRTDRIPSVEKLAVGFACPTRRCYNTANDMDYRSCKNQNKIKYSLCALMLAPMWKEGFRVTPELFQSGPTPLNALRMPSTRRTGASSIASIEDIYCPLLIDLVPNYSLSAECLLIFCLLARKRPKWTLLTVALLWVCICGSVV